MTLSTPLDEEREREIRARLAARTQGKWSHVTTLPLCGYVASCGGSDEIGHHYVAPEGAHAFRTNGAISDAEFIAHAPSDLAYLLSVVEELRERLSGGIPRSLSEEPAGIQESILALWEAEAKSDLAGHGFTDDAVYDEADTVLKLIDEVRRLRSRPLPFSERAVSDT